MSIQITFTLEQVANELNTYFNKNKIKIVYFEDNIRNCFVYRRHTSINDEDISTAELEEYENRRDDEKNIVEKIDYKNLTLDNLLILLKEDINDNSEDDGEYNRPLLLDLLYNYYTVKSVIVKDNEKYHLYIDYKL